MFKIKKTREKKTQNPPKKYLYPAQSPQKGDWVSWAFKKKSI